MTVRHSDQDVGELYCAIRDALARDAMERGWARRWLDFVRPEAARARREALVAAAYVAWKDARPLPEEREVQPLNHRATTLALDMVRAQRRGQHYAPARVISVRSNDVP